MKKRKKRPLPRNWKERITEITSLNFCDRACPCGDNNQLWWFPVIGDHDPDWVPGWMNGGDTNEIWNWLVKNGKV